MAFENQSAVLTVPNGAGPGTPRVVLGQAAPQELKDRYGSTVACILLYTGGGAPEPYEYLVSYAGGMAIGTVFNGVVAELINLNASVFTMESASWKGSDSFITGSERVVDTSSTPMSGWCITRKLPVGRGTILLDGEIAFNTQNHSNGIGIGTVHPAHRPKQDINVPVACDGQGTGQSPHLFIQANGGVSVWGLTGATGFSVHATYGLLEP